MNGRNILGRIDFEIRKGVSKDIFACSLESAISSKLAGGGEKNYDFMLSRNLHSNNVIGFDGEP